MLKPVVGVTCHIVVPIVGDTYYMMMAILGEALHVHVNEVPLS